MEHAIFTMLVCLMPLLKIAVSSLCRKVTHAACWAVTAVLNWMDDVVHLSVDPNREGLSTRLVGYLRSCGVRRLVYVSCDPATLARDLQLLCAASPPDLQQRASNRWGHLLTVTPSGFAACAHR